MATSFAPTDTSPFQPLELISSIDFLEVLSDVSLNLRSADQSGEIDNLTVHKDFHKLVEQLGPAINKYGHTLTMDTYMMPNGKEETYINHGRKTKESDPGPHSVAAVCLFRSEDGTWCTKVTEQYRPVQSGKMTMEFPCGMREEGESVMTAGIREFEEETGVDSSQSQVDVIYKTSAAIKDTGMGSATESTVVIHAREYTEGAVNLDEGEKAAKLQSRTVRVDELGSYLDAFRQRGGEPCAALENFVAGMKAQQFLQDPEAYLAAINAEGQQSVVEETAPSVGQEAEE